MSSQSPIAAAALVPLIRYSDVGKAIDWLCDAFGFEKHVVVTGVDGAIIYAQLQCGSGLVMVCPAEGSGLDNVMRQPDELGGVATQCCYLVVADADAHYRRSTAAGAQIVHDGQSSTDIRRGYSCRDLEGHIWSFGTFDPWRNKAPAIAGPRDVGRGLRGALLRAAAIATVILGAGATAAVMYEPARDALARWNSERPAAVRTADADSTARRAEQQLAAANDARQDAERAARELQGKLDTERQARDAATRTADSLKAELEKMRGAKEKVAQELAKAQAATQGWMLRAEQAESKAVTAAEATNTKPSTIETGSPGPIAPKPAPEAAGTESTTTAGTGPPPERTVRPRPARRAWKPKYVIVEKDWSSFAAW